MTSHNYRTVVSQPETWLLSMAYARLSSRNQIPKFILGINVIWTDYVKDEHAWSDHKKTHREKKKRNLPSLSYCYRYLALIAWKESIHGKEDFDLKHFIFKQGCLSWV